MKALWNDYESVPQISFSDDFDSLGASTRLRDAQPHPEASDAARRAEVQDTGHHRVCGARPVPQQQRKSETAIDSKRAEDYKVSPQTIAEQKIEVTPVDT